MDSSTYFTSAGYLKHYQTLPRRRKTHHDHLYNSNTIVHGLPPSGRPMRSPISPLSSYSPTSPLSPMSISSASSSSSPHSSTYHLQVTRRLWCRSITLICNKLPYVKIYPQYISTFINYITERSVRWYYGISIAAASARRPWRHEHSNSINIQPISFKFYMRVDTP